MAEKVRLFWSNVKEWFQDMYFKYWYSKTNKEWIQLTKELENLPPNPSKEIAE